MGVRLFSPRISQGGGDRPSSALSLGREAAALVLLAAAIYLGLALASLHLSSGGSSEVGGNWVGPVGAWIAELLASAFGVVAWLLPLELVLLAIPIFRDRPRPPLGPRLAGDLALGILFSALTHVALPETTFQGSLPAGGNVGQIFGEISRALFSTLGSFLVGGTAIALLLIARSAFSFIEWCERTSDLLRRARTDLVALLARVREAWRARRGFGAGGARALAVAGNGLRLPDGSGPWSPREETGSPPPAISAALRKGLSLPARLASEPLLSAAPASARDDSAEEEQDATEEEEAASPAPPVARSRRRAKPEPAARVAEPEVTPRPAPAAVPAPPANAGAGPRIVDTRPHGKQLRASSATSEESNGSYVPPSPDLLQPTPVETTPVDRARILELAQRL
ncbi:MAG TPA: DNA translocase FtsK 4TM domain-containing protein, partial [Polyangiaceae bacterium]|nr:DNA translocase FtsK 4TM domain-containing protein [Polyangiaceae bacterium]